jgi:ABC-2 type transport system permease protein
MHKFFVIFKREYAQVVKRKWFIVSIFLTPLFMVAITLIPSYFADTKASKAEEIAIVDRSGSDIGERFIETIKTYKLENSDKPYYEVKRLVTLSPTDSVAYIGIMDTMRQAISDQTYRYCVLIQPNAFLSDTGVSLITNSTSFTTLERFTRDISRILASKRLQLSNINLSVDSVLNLTEQIHLTIKDTKGESVSFQVKYFGGFILVMIMFMMVITYGTQVMRTVIEEKNSRVMEVLVSSVTPFQLMMGKILGLGAATFTTIAAWLAMGIVIFLMSGAAMMAYAPGVAHFALNPMVVTFFILYLISGYVLYSTLFALIGSIVSSEKEAQSLVFPITMSIMMPVFFGLSVVQEPNSTLALTLSFIPFFTPTMMMMRIAFLAPTTTSYSLFSGILGQATLGLLLVILTTILVIWLTSKIFRVGILMYGKRPTFPEIVKWIKY